MATVVTQMYFSVALLNTATEECLLRGTTWIFV